MPDLFDKLISHVRQIAYLESTQELLHWDERTQMPAQGAEYRAEQLATLAAEVHRRSTSAELGQWLEELASEASDDPHEERATTIRQLKRSYDKQIKLPTSLVEALSRATSHAHQAWVEARAADDFSRFAPQLSRVIELKKQQAASIGYADQLYDALLDEYEPQATTRQLTELLGAFRQQLVPLVAAVTSSSRRPNKSLLQRQFPIAAQQSLGKQAAEAIGFDFARGRLDVTHHPFCTSVGPNDCRITTRYDEHFFPAAFFSILHEAGHGIYDQGLPNHWYGLPPGSFVSLGIHESQSRLWENLVGRSDAFWRHFYCAAQQLFPDALGDVQREDFVFAVNLVEPSLIRVEADELTYNLHVIIRFELEQAIFSDDLDVAELPPAWNAKYRDYLGIAPPSDADGVLQDVHWCEGLFGYFPTYSLGNLYAAQFWAAAEQQVGPLQPQLANGDFAPLRRWLGEQIHRRGQRYTASQLVQLVTGAPLSQAALIDYLRDKYGALYL